MKIIWLKIRAWVWGKAGSVLYRIGLESPASSAWAVAWGHNDYIQYLEMSDEEKERLGIDGKWKHQAEWTAEDVRKWEEKQRNEKPFIKIWVNREAVK